MSACADGLYAACAAGTPSTAHTRGPPPSMRESRRSRARAVRQGAKKVKGAGAYRMRPYGDNERKEDENMVVYIAGPITGVANYRIRKENRFL